MQREQKNLIVRQTANLTSKMREERQTETFEPTSPSSASQSAESSSCNSTSKESIRKTEQSETQNPNRVVRIQKEHVVKYDANLNSMYEKTCDTRSMNSIPEPDDLEEFGKLSEESRKIGPQIVPIKYVRAYIETPIQAVFVSDFELCESIANPTSKSLGASQYKRVEFARRFEAEHKFIEEILSDIDKLLLASGRTDVELRVCKERDVNGMPRCKIQMVRKIKAEQGHRSQCGLVAVDAPDLAVTDGNREEEKSKISTMRSLPTSNVATRIYNSLKRRFGL